MKLSINILSVFITVFLSTQITFAQRPNNTGNITKGKGIVIGKVIESNNNNELQFASISILSVPENKIITGGMTDEEGKFKIEAPYGKYYVLVDFMGFAKKKTTEFELSKENRIVKMGKILIDPDTDIIGEVEITAEKELFENKIDSKTFNVSKDITMQSKSALEALEQIPSISVDIDGNISLRGNGNVRILINNRPIVVTAENQAALLEQIQANNIESIDVITNPSAKYNPEGMGGIINIQLKKAQEDGRNLAITLSSDFFREAGANISGGIRTKKISIYGTYGYKYNKWNYERTSFQKNIYTDTTNYMNQSSEGGRLSNSHMGTFGLDYNINKNNLIGVEALLSYANKDKSNPFNYDFFDEDLKLRKSTLRDNTEDIIRTKMDIQANFKHKFNKKKHYIEANISHSRNQHQEDANYFETTIFPVKGDTIDLENNLQNDQSAISNYKVNYHYPISEKSSIETGLDGEYRQIDNKIDVLSFDTNNGIFKPDTKRSSQFNYTDQTHALYGLFKFSFGKLNYQIGIRLEYSDYKFNLDNKSISNTYKQRYNYYPSLHLQYKLTPTSELGASYSKRVNRPSVRQLNPLHDYADTYNYRVGNPNLEPENIHSAELSYSKKWDKLKLIPAIYYKYIDNVIKRIKSRDTSGIGVVSYMNLNYGSSYGSELIASYKFNKWLDLNGSANVGYSKMQDKTNGSLSNEDFAWSGKIRSSIKLPYGIKFQISYHYYGERVIPQGYIEPMQWLDLGLRKSFWDNKATLSVRASDILRTREFNIHIDTDEYLSNLHFKRYPTYVLVSFTYQIGKAIKKKRSRSSRGGGDDIGM